MLIKSLRRVRQFVEKPDRATAEAKADFASGEYVWNSGIFMFHAQRRTSKH